MSEKSQGGRLMFWKRLVLPNWYNENRDEAEQLMAEVEERKKNVEKRLAVVREIMDTRHA